MKKKIEMEFSGVDTLSAVDEWTMNRILDDAITKVFKDCSASLKKVTVDGNVYWLRPSEETR